MAERDEFTFPGSDTLHRLAVRLDAYATRAEQAADALARIPEADPRARVAEGQTLRLAANIAALLSGLDESILDRKLEEAAREGATRRKLANRRAA